MPDVSDDVAFRRDDSHALRLLLALLRAADCLDSRSLPSPRILISRRGRRIQIFST